MLGPILLLILVGSGLAFASGLLRWEWLEERLGLDRGFISEAPVQAASSTTGGGGQADVGWRLPPGQSYEERQAAGGQSGGSGVSRPTAPPDRVATVVREARAQQRAAPAASNCADSASVARLILRYPEWSDGDLSLISCARLRTGFITDQVRASLGNPDRVERSGPAGAGRETWRYEGLTVIVEQGRVISFGQ